MLILHCTKKIAAYLTESEQGLAQSAEFESHWHTHLLNLQKRKYVFFMHDATRFLLIARAVKKAELLNLHALFLTCLKHTLLLE